MRAPLTEGAQRFYVQAAAAEPSQVEEPGVNIALTDAFRGNIHSVCVGGGSLSCLLFYGYKKGWREKEYFTKLDSGNMLGFLWRETRLSRCERTEKQRQSHVRGCANYSFRNNKS